MEYYFNCNWVVSGHKGPGIKIDRQEERTCIPLSFSYNLVNSLCGSIKVPLLPIIFLLLLFVIHSHELNSILIQYGLQRILTNWYPWNFFQALILWPDLLS
jgi:hypothetical protein